MILMGFKMSGNRDDWAAFGTDQATGQPIPTCAWIDRLAPRAWAVVAASTCSSYSGIHAMAGNPTGCIALPDYPGARTWPGSMPSARRCVSDRTNKETRTDL